MPPVTRSMRARGEQLFDSTHYTGRRVRMRGKGIYEVTEDSTTAQQTGNIAVPRPSNERDKILLRIRSVLEARKKDTLTRELEDVARGRNWSQQRIQQRKRQIRERHRQRNRIWLSTARNDFLNNDRYQLLDAMVQRRMDGDSNTDYDGETDEGSETDEHTTDEESDVDEESSDEEERNSESQLDDSSGEDEDERPTLDNRNGLGYPDPNPVMDLLPSEKRIRNWRERAARLRRNIRPGVRLYADEPTYSTRHPAPFWEYPVPDAFFMVEYLVRNYDGACIPLDEAYKNDWNMQAAAMKEHWESVPPVPWPSYNLEYDSLMQELPTCAFVHIGQWQYYSPDMELRLMYHLALFFGAPHRVIPRLIPQGPWKPVTRAVDQERRPLSRTETIWEFQYTGIDEQRIIDEVLHGDYNLFVDRIREEYRRWWRYSQRSNDRALWARDPDDQRGSQISDRNCRISIEIKRAFRRLLKVLLEELADEEFDSDNDDEAFNDLGPDRDEEVLPEHQANDRDINERIQAALRRARARPVRHIIDDPADQGRLLRVSRWWVRHSRPQAVREHMWARRTRTLVNRRRVQEDLDRRRRGGGMFVPRPPIQTLADVPGNIFWNRLSIEQPSSSDSEAP